ncbi:MAG: hypothetical protein ACUVXF_00485 [Desulfobaccales bacterium]
MEVERINHRLSSWSEGGPQNRRSLNHQARDEVGLKRKILIFSVDQEFAQKLTVFLGHQGYRLYVAPDLEAVLEEMYNYTFDLLIIQMNRGNPLNMAVVRQAQRPGNRTRVLVVSSSQGDLFPLEAFQAEVGDYLVFPFSTAELARRVAALLGSTDLNPSSWVSKAE